MLLRACVSAALLILSVGSLQPVAAQTLNVKISDCWYVITPPSPGIDSYNVKLSLTPGGPYTFRTTNVPATNWQNSTRFPGDIFITCTDAGLDVADVPSGSSFLDYFVVSTAVNIVGDESGNSNEASARLHVPPGKPNNARFDKSLP